MVNLAEFYNNLESMNTYEQGETVDSIAKLLVEQVEFSNVIVFNTGTLVSVWTSRKILFTKLNSPVNTI